MKTYRKLVRADKVSERTTIVRLGVVQVAVMRDGGEVIAFKHRCPHAGAPLGAGRIKDGRVECPRHGWSFELRDGGCKGHPGFELHRYEIRERDGWIEVAVEE